MEQDVETTHTDESVTGNLSIPTRKRSRAFFILLIVLSVAAVVSFLVYRLPINHPFVRAVIAIVPYPAVTMKGSYVRMSTYAEEQQALNQFLSVRDLSQSSNSDVLRQTVLEGLVHKAMIQTLAKEANIRIDHNRVERYYQEVIAREESEEVFEKKISDTFGWNATKFKKQIIESIILALQMTEFVSSDEKIQASSRLQIEQAESQLANGTEFWDVAREVYKEANTVMDADLGYHLLSDLPSQWSPVSFLEKGERTGIIQSADSFFILYVEDRIVTQDATQLHLLTISVSKKSLETLVKERLETADVRYYVNE